MSSYRKCFLKLLSLLNDHMTHEAREYLEGLHLRYECSVEQGLISKILITDNVDGKFYNLLFWLNRGTGKYIILTPNPRKNLFNTDPSTLISYGIGTKQTTTVKVKDMHNVQTSKSEIIVFSSESHVTAMLDRAKEIYGFNMLINHDSNNDSLLDSLKNYYNDGYRNFVIGIKLTNDTLKSLTEWTITNKDVRVVDYINDEAEHCSYNMLRMNCSNEMMYNAYTSCINKPTLFISDTEHLTAANKMAELLPGSQVVKLSTNANVNDVINDTHQSIFLLVPDKVICSINHSINHELWVLDKSQVGTWGSLALHSVSLHYPTTIRSNKMFKHASMHDYLAVDALYYMDYYLRTGARPISGLSGVYEFDTNGNRIWHNFVKIMHHSNRWVQNYITEIEPKNNSQKK